MKVVCLSLPIDDKDNTMHGFITINKTYMVLWTAQEDPMNFFEELFTSFRMKRYVIEDDCGFIRSYNTSLFKSIDKVREENLNKLGI